jgi:hypothetical protein
LASEVEAAAIAVPFREPLAIVVIDDPRCSRFGLPGAPWQQERSVLLLPQNGTPNSGLNGVPLRQPRINRSMRQVI